MATLETMYRGVTNSPSTNLTASIDGNSTVIQVENASKLGIVYPNLLVIGDSETSETVIATSVTDNQITIQRGADGTIPQAWGVGSNVARNFTNYDYEQLRQNVILLNQDIENLQDDVVVINKKFINNNLLVNSNLKTSELINQRGKLQYIGGWEYGFDNFEYFTTTTIGHLVSLENEYVRLITTNGLYTCLRSKIEKLTLGTHTLSIKFKGTSGERLDLKFNTITKSIICTGSWQEEFITTEITMIDNNVIEAWFYVVNGNGICDISYFKVESSYFPTKFIDDNPADKLAKCQRYLQILNVGGSTVSISTALPHNSTSIRFPISLPVTLRKNPTLIFDKNNGSLFIRNTELVLNITDANILLSATTYNLQYLNVLLSESALIGNTIYTLSGVLVRILFSAEL